MLYAPLACYDAFRHPWRARAAAVAGTALILGGYFVSPGGFNLVALFNRVLALVTLLAAIFAGSRLARLRLERADRARLAGQIEGIYAAAPVGLGFIDTSLRFQRVNQRFADINGKAVEAHIGRTIGEVLPAPISCKVEEVSRRVIEGGRPRRGIRLADDGVSQPGVRRQFLFSFEPVKDPGGRVLGVNTIVQDLTRLTTHERTWQARVARLQALYTLSELEAGSAGVDEICKAALDGIEKGLQASRAGVLLEDDRSGLRFHAARGIPGRSQSRLARLVSLETASSPLEPLIVRDVTMLPDGPFRHLLRQERIGALLTVPLDHVLEGARLIVAWDHPRSPSREVLDNARALARHVATAMERERRERALALSEGRFRALSESGILAVATFDMEGRIFEANDAFLEMVRHSRADLAAGRVRWDELTPPEWMARTRQAMEELATTGRISPYEKEYLRRDGTRLWGLFGGARLGRANRGVAFVLDITQRKEAERSLKELTESLELRVVERTQQAEWRAARARAMAVELAQAEDRERRRLSRILHDDLQQYLVAARVQLAGLKSQAGTAELAAGLAKLGSLLSESLDATRTLTRELTPPILQTSGLVASLEWLSTWMRDRHGISIDVSAEDGCDDVSDDAKMLAFQAVRELLLNVVKHADVDEAFVHLGPCQGKIQVAVEDKGRGFDPALLDRPTTGATGVGLAGLKQRVADLGGSLTIESGPGKGTRIRFTLPHLPVSSPAGADDSRAPAIRVLVADDHTLVRQGVVSLLASEPGIRVVGEASDGVEVVGRAEALRPDVVVMDVRMPGMDGIEATRRIKEALPDTQVVAMSQFTDDEAGRHMRAAGARLFISKDEAHQRLVPCIRSLKEGSMP
jgi:PAS domain S-box-containing protein